MTMFSAPAALARSNPATKVLYSTSLLVVGKSKQIMHSILSPPKVWSTMPAPPACLFEDPSIWMLHCGTTSAPWPSMRVNSTMKSATTYPLIAVRGRYNISNSLSSSCRFGATHGSSQRLIHQNNNCMCFEVRFKFSCHGHQREHQLLQLGVPCSSKPSACKVNRSLQSILFYYQSHADSSLRDD